MNQPLIFRTSLGNGFFWGIAGAFCWLLIRFLPFTVAIREAGMMLAYVLFLLLCIRTFRPLKGGKNFARTFLTILLTFMLMPIVTHVGLFFIFFNEPFPDLVAPFFIMLGVGTAVSLLLALFATRRGYHLKTPPSAR